MGYFMFNFFGKKNENASEVNLESVLEGLNFENFKDYVFQNYWSIQTKACGEYGEGNKSNLNKLEEAYLMLKPLMIEQERIEYEEYFSSKEKMYMSCCYVILNHIDKTKVVKHGANFVKAQNLIYSV
jgi:coenzyme F420-reducing hydrogenase delta subunit